MFDLNQQPHKPLPDPERCYSSDIGVKELAECKVRNPLECRYALRFGYSWLCRHPQWRQFASTAPADGLPPAPDMPSPE